MVNIAEKNCILESIRFDFTSSNPQIIKLRYDKNICLFFPVPADDHVVFLVRKCSVCLCGVFDFDVALVRKWHIGAI